MRPIYEMSVIQIEVTNACHLRCANCTRFIGHHRKPYFMDLGTIEKALDSLEGFPGHVGLMGGEPTLHPDFKDICKLYQEKIPEKGRREFWTAGYKWDEYKNLINETFDEEYIAFNDHSKPDEGQHQPLLIAIDDVVEDKELMWKLIDNCWVQLRWSASITPKGAFFCEVAAAQDRLFNGPGGYPVEKGWWQREPKDFQDQVRRYCPQCSAALPMYIPNNHETHDSISPGNAKRLREVKSPKFEKGHVIVEDVQKLASYLGDTDGTPGEDRGSFESHPEWHPWCYRSEVWHAPGEGDLSAEEVRALQTGKANNC